MYHPTVRRYVVLVNDVIKYINNNNNNNNNNNKPLIFKTYHCSIFISERIVSNVTSNDR